MKMGQEDLTRPESQISLECPRLHGMKNLQTDQFEFGCFGNGCLKSVARF